MLWQNTDAFGNMEVDSFNFCYLYPLIQRAWVKRWRYHVEFDLVIFVAIAKEVTKSTDY